MRPCAAIVPQRTDRSEPNHYRSVNRLQKLAVREYSMRHQTLTILGFGLGIATCLVGCRAWTGGYPLQSPARVQPPGTGTYQVPSSYYNQAGANVSTNYQQGIPGQGFVSAPGVAVGPQSLNTGFAPTNLTNAAPPVIPNAGQPSAVVPANYAAPAQPVYNNGVQPAAASGGASFNMSDTNDGSNLDWNP